MIILRSRGPIVGDSWGNLQSGVDIGVAAGGHSLNIVERIVFANAVSVENIHSFVVGDGGLLLGCIAPHQIIAMNMNADSINVLSVFVFTADAVIGIQYLYIFTAEIGGITVDKAKIPTFHSVVFDTVAGDQINLHTIVGHEIVITPAHDFMGGIIEQIIHVKFQNLCGTHVVVKQFLTHIDGFAKVNAIVAEIYDADPFFEGEGRACVKLHQIYRGIIQKPTALKVGGMSQMGSIVTAQTDMFSTIGQGCTKIRRAVLSVGGTDAAEGCILL